MDSNDIDTSPSAAATSPSAAATSPSAAATSPSAVLHDSAIFGDIDKLSPITAVKASLEITTFTGLSSPIVFASPNLNPSAGSYSKSFQFTTLSSEEVCQHDSGGKNREYIICQDVSCFTNKKSESSSSLIHCTHRERDSGSREDQFCTPFGCFDKFMIDAVEVEYENGKASNDLIQLNQCPDSQTKFESIGNVRQDAEEAIATFPDMLQFEEQNYQENPSYSAKTFETNANNEGNGLHSRSKDIEPEDEDISDGVSEFLSQSKKNVIGYKDGSKAIGEVSCQNYENEVFHVSKGQRSHGLQRRRLQFEESARCVIEDTPSSWNPSTSETNRRSPCPVESEVLEPPVSERTAISGSSHTANSNKPISMISRSRHSNSRSTVSKPSGIGLHLNSIISAKPKCVSTGVSVTSEDKGCLDVQGEKLSCYGHYPQESTNNGSISLKIGERFSTTGQNQEAFDSHCPKFGSSTDPAFRDYQATPYGKRKFTLEQDCTFEESNQSSPQKKSKKVLANSEGDGCKRCNCKKTKCLKLYCDCFAAGIYCSGTCSCQGCFNRPDYVDTVLEVRQQIESKNPLAFAPKVVERLIDTHVDSNRNDGINSTPASARHTRGCNCKKSMCMKKYCECYQNNVGCSSGCRCDGCQNVFGKKNDYHGARNAFGIPASEARDENADLVSKQDCFLRNEQSNHHIITPMTPSFQLSKHEKDGLKSKFSAISYLPSPESDLSLMQNCGGSIGTIDNYSVPANSRKEGVVSSLEFDCGDGGKVNVFSPTDGLSDMGNSSRVHKPRDQLPFSSPIGRFGRDNLLTAGFEEKLDNVLEDDTPEILKDQINCVKVSSPNKKRVSPPRICGLRQLGSSFSSASLKSGRKFILRALPSFPPLTPCIDGKDSSSRVKEPRDM